MVRVLHVIGSLNNGGSQAMIMNIYRSIDREKVQFDFIIDREEEIFFADEIKQLGGKIYVMPIFNLKNIFNFIREWNRFFCEHKEYRIIHGHVRSTAAIYLYIAKKYKLKTISHSHSTSSGNGILAIIKAILQYPIRYVADEFIACSQESGIWLFGKRVCRKDNFFILKNAIDCEKFSYDEVIRREIREELKIEEDDILIGHIGRFEFPKNHDFLVDIFKEVNRKNPKLKLCLVGDGSKKIYIENKVKRLNLERDVVFLGVRNDINKLMMAFDLFVFPSIFEGLPVTLIEAQASGLKCIISNNITREVNISKDIDYLNIINKEEWISFIIKYAESYKGRKNISNVKLIKDAGYDIETSIKELEKIYCIN